MDTPSSTANGAVAPGDVLGGRYRLAGRIGAGGMAVIYRARDLTLDRDVAVKVLHPHLADDPVVQARFRTEARHAAGLNHPHVVSIYDQGADETPYIVMEHVDGPSLREVLVRRGPLSAPEVLSLVEPVCRALARAHDAGLVHRDIKPENILVSPDGLPKVADFGIARAVAATNLTETGTLVGSVHYLAPEIVDGREASPRSDQYALGVVVFELLTGRKPLPAESMAAVMRRHAQEPIPVPSEFAPDIPAALDDVVARATALDPAERFGDLRELAEALVAAVPSGAAPVEIVHGDDDQTVVVDPAAMRSDTPPLVVALPRETTPAASPAPRRPRRGRRVVRWLAIVLLLAALGAGGGWAAWNFAIAPEQAIPSLAGMTRTEAVAALQPMGLLVTVAGERHELTQPAGVVLRQDPPPGTRLRRGGTVAIVLSLGPEPVVMPNVLGMPRDEAITTLEGPPYFFAIAAIHESHHDTEPAGDVVGQNPGPEEGLRAGDEVVINVSLGIEQVEVPDVSDMTQEEAEAALTGARLAVELTAEWNDDVPEAGRVISQSIGAGETVDKGSVVAVVVSRGPLTIRMPDVRGDGIDSARAELEALALRVRIVGEPRERIGPFRRGEFGRVEEQFPEAGHSVQREETVTLFTYSEAAEQDD